MAEKKECSAWVRKDMFLCSYSTQKTVYAIGIG